MSIKNASLGNTSIETFKVSDEVLSIGDAQPAIPEVYKALTALIPNQVHPVSSATPPSPGGSEKKTSTIDFKPSVQIPLHEDTPERLKNYGISMKRSLLYAAVKVEKKQMDFLLDAIEATRVESRFLERIIELLYERLLSGDDADYLVAQIDKVNSELEKASIVVGACEDLLDALDAADRQFSASASSAEKTQFFMNSLKNDMSTSEILTSATEIGTIEGTMSDLTSINESWWRGTDSPRALRTKCSLQLLSDIQFTFKYGVSPSYLYDHRSAAKRKTEDLANPGDILGINASETDWRAYINLGGAAVAGDVESYKGLLNFTQLGYAGTHLRDSLGLSSTGKSALSQIPLFPVSTDSSNPFDNRLGAPTVAHVGYYCVILAREFLFSGGRARLMGTPSGMAAAMTNPGWYKTFFGAGSISNVTDEGTVPQSLADLYLWDASGEPINASTPNHNSNPVLILDSDKEALNDLNSDVNITVQTAKTVFFETLKKDTFNNNMDVYEGIINTTHQQYDKSHKLIKKYLGRDYERTLLNPSGLYVRILKEFGIFVETLAKKAGSIDSNRMLAELIILSKLGQGRDTINITSYACLCLSKVIKTAINKYSDYSEALYPGVNPTDSEKMSDLPHSPNGDRWQRFAQGIASDDEPPPNLYNNTVSYIPGMGVIEGPKIFFDGFVLHESITAMDLVNIYQSDDSYVSNAVCQIMRDLQKEASGLSKLGPLEGEPYKDMGYTLNSGFDTGLTAAFILDSFAKLTREFVQCDYYSPTLQSELQLASNSMTQDAAYTMAKKSAGERSYQDILDTSLDLDSFKQMLLDVRESAQSFFAATVSNGADLMGSGGVDNEAIAQYAEDKLTELLGGGTFGHAQAMNLLYEEVIGDGIASTSTQKAHGAGSSLYKALLGHPDVFNSNFNNAAQYAHEFIYTADRTNQAIVMRNKALENFDPQDVWIDSEVAKNFAKKYKMWANLDKPAGETDSKSNLLRLTNFIANLTAAYETGDITVMFDSSGSGLASPDVDMDTPLSHPGAGTTITAGDIVNELKALIKEDNIIIKMFSLSKAYVDEAHMSTKEIVRWGNMLRSDSELSSLSDQEILSNPDIPDPVKRVKIAAKESIGRDFITYVDREQIRMAKRRIEKFGLAAEKPSMLLAEKRDTTFQAMKYLFEYLGSSPQYSWTAYNQSSGLDSDHLNFENGQVVFLALPSTTLSKTIFDLGDEMSWLTAGLRIKLDRQDEVHTELKFKGAYYDFLLRLSIDDDGIEQAFKPQSESITAPDSFLSLIEKSYWTVEGIDGKVLGLKILDSAQKAPTTSRKKMRNIMINTMIDFLMKKFYSLQLSMSLDAHDIQFNESDLMRYNVESLDLLEKVGAYLNIESSTIRSLFKPPSTQLDVYGNPMPSSEIFSPTKGGQLYDSMVNPVSENIFVDGVVQKIWKVPKITESQISILCSMLSTLPAFVKKIQRNILSTSVFDRVFAVFVPVDGMLLKNVYASASPAGDVAKKLLGEGGSKFTLQHIYSWNKDQFSTKINIDTLHCSYVKLFESPTFE